ncbi:MAG: gliding motility-associated C-terminal domain-containing protein [Candidatus Latescibacteria bacterium]|nr:gliding motility-associated C-terminal domain-containing protein [Candidatus Latescibacterota bacterium]
MKTFRPNVQAEFAPVTKDFKLDPPVLMGRLDINSTAPRGLYVETAEVGVYGTGFPTDASFTSEIIDVGTAPPRFRRFSQQMELFAASYSAKLATEFPDRAGRLVNWGKVRWKGRRLGEGDEGQVRIQFRAGNSPDTHVYARSLGPGLSDNRDNNGQQLTAFKWAKLTDGRIEEVSLQYNELGQRLGADEVRGWSYWSAPFSFEEGLIDTTLPPEQWQNTGVALPLPGGTRYIQFRLLFDSDQQSAVSLDYLEFDYDVPLASGGVLAEIFPAQVPLGQDQSFHYYLRPLFGEGDGGSFNRIEIAVPDAATRIEALRFDGQDWQQIDSGTGADPLALVQPQRLAPAAGRADSLGQFAQAIRVDSASGAARLLVKLPPMSARHFRLGESLEIVFTSKLFRGAKQFTSAVWNDQNGAQGTTIPQPTEGGDATPEVATDDVNVVVEQIDQTLSPVRLSANPFTPNGDGINDQLQISFDLFLLLQQVQVQVDILDLSGRQVAQVGPLAHTAGTAQITWDGKNSEGKLLPPGLYLYHLKVGGTAAASEQTGTLSLVY